MLWKHIRYSVNSNAHWTRRERGGWRRRKYAQTLMQTTKYIHTATIKTIIMINDNYDCEMIHTKTKATAAAAVSLITLYTFSWSQKHLASFLCLLQFICINSIRYIFMC